MKICILGMLLTVLVCGGCGIKMKPGEPSIVGSGVSKTDSRNIVDFKKIKAENAIDLDIKVTNGYSVIVKADDNIVANVVTKLDGDTLVISLKDGIDTKSRVNVTITLPLLTSLELTGATNANISGVKGDEFSLNATGAAKAKIAGETKSLKVKAVGASNVDTESLSAEKANVESVGASSVTVSATSELNASATGASHVTYVGDPKTLNQSATDVSTISKK
ncbi:MAG: DUF2807 domain-containing protein [Pyrinomonadaceae bacterium]